ncbi:acyl--CoA ligase [Rhodobacteraceae bacterium D3-12]|nr:acyl--CoA ligase [Rhodobacteraceae bacterium D3-12]
MNLAEALEIHARAQPEHPAVIAGTTTVTHADFAARVRDLAAGLLERGIRPGDLVGVCLSDSIDHLVANFAVIRMGAVLLPMDLRWTRAEQQRLAMHFGCTLVLAETDAAPLVGVACASMAATMGQGATPIAPGGDAPLLLSLSSGTTGRPKGPLITHAHMLRRFWTHWMNIGLNASERYVSATPLYFGGGRTFAMSVLFSGGTVILFPPPFRAPDLLAELARTRATSAFLVPTQLRKLLAEADAVLAPARALRTLISSGAPLDPEERRDLCTRVCANFIEYYASTEGGGVSISTPATRTHAPDSVGRPVFAVEAQVVDDAHTPLPAGQVGRFRYRGPGVADSYHMDDEASRDAFHDGWFYPGDLAEIDAGGHITLRGRTKDMIIRGGVNIHPGEIETILRDHSSVRDAAVVGWPSKTLGEEVAAFVVTEGPTDAEVLTDWCRSQLAPYKVPALFVSLDDMPRNSAGKVLKAKLATRLPDRDGGA